jgi:hypothetical protein
MLIYLKSRKRRKKPQQIRRKLLNLRLQPLLQQADQV